MPEVPVITDSARPSSLVDPAFLRAVFDSLEDSIVVGAFPDRVILDVNPAFERLFGYSAAEARGQPTTLMHVDAAHFEEFGNLVAPLLRRGETLRFEFPFRRKDGRVFLGEITLCPLSIADERGFGAVSIIRDVSQQRAAERALRESEGRLQLVSEAMHEVPWDWNLHTGAYWWSRNLRMVFGYAPEDVLGGVDTWYERIHPDERARVMRDVQHVIASGGVHWEDEHRFRRADGAYAHVLARGQVLRDPSGRATRMVGSLADVTARRREEERVRRRERRIQAEQQALLDLTHASGAPDRTLDGIFRRATELAARTLDVARAGIWMCEPDYTGLRCVDTYEHPSGARHQGATLPLAPDSLYWQALRNGRTVAASAACSDPRTDMFAEGYFIPNGVSSTIDAPIRVGGRLVGIVCHEHVGEQREWEQDEESFAASVADLVALAIEDDERRRAERALRDSEAQMAAILDNMPVAVYTRGLDGRIRFANDVCAQGLRRAKPDIVGREERDLVTPEIAATSARTDALALRHGTHTSEETVTLFGHERTLLVTKFVLRDHEDEPYAIGGVIADLTDRKAAEREILAARRQVTHSEKLSALGSLVSGVAHEIRTPLTYLNNHLFVLDARLGKALETLPPGETRAILAATRANLKAAEEGADRIKHLVDDLRRFTRLKAGEREELDLAEVVEEALGLFRAAHQGRATVAADLAPTPPLPLDKVQVQQVVINLLENAVDASPSGATVSIATRATPEGVELVVEDRGAGIPPEVQAQMFDPFYTTKPEGTGLGLAIVRRIVEEHNGVIRCESRVGAGTRFVVSFPRP